MKVIRKLALTLMCAVLLVSGSGLVADGAPLGSELTRARAAHLLVEALRLPTLLPSSAYFSDVPLDHPEAAYIYAMAAKGVIKGYPDNSFKPSGLLNRAEFALVFCKAYGITPHVPASPTYSDVPSTHFGFGSIEALTLLGVVRGLENGTFQPDAFPTEEDVMAMVGNYRDKVINITGHVRDNTGAALPAVIVMAHDYDTNRWGGDAVSQSDGSYAIKGLPAGTYRVSAGGVERERKWYDNTYLHHEAQQVTVAVPGLATNISFNLGPAGKISGIVRNAAGSPLGGISVDAYRADGSSGSGTITNPDGSYVIDGIPYGVYQVVSPSPGRHGQNDGDWAWQKHGSSFTLSSGNTDQQNVNFSLANGGQISGRIVDSNGQGLAHIPVWTNRRNATDNWENVSKTQTNADGYYVLRGIPDGSYKVCAGISSTEVLYPGTYNWSSATMLNMAASQAIGDIDFGPPVGGSISGRVTDDLGSPIANANVWADFFNDSSKSAGGTTTAADGTYRINGLATGTYRLQAVAAGRVKITYNNKLAYHEGSPVQVTVPDDTPDVNFSLAPGGSISGTIRDPSGSPLSGISINADCTSGQGGNGGETGSDGTYTIIGLPFGTYRVQSPSPDRRSSSDGDWGWQVHAESVSITSAQPARNGVDFGLQQGGSISGRLVNKDGNAVANSPVFADKKLSADSWLTVSTAKTNENGDYTLRGLSSGEYKVGAAVPLGEVWYAGTFSWNQATIITMNAPQALTGKNLAVPDSGSVSGFVINESSNPIAGAHVWAETMDGVWVAGANTGADGGYRLPVPTGTYRITAKAAGRVTKSYNNVLWYSNPTPVNVTSPNDTAGINFSLEPGGEISGTVTNSSGAPLQGISVDLIRTNGPGGMGAITKADGSYSFGGIPYGEYTVTAPSKNRFGPNDGCYMMQQRTGLAVSSQNPNVTANLGPLTQGGSIVGTVLDRDTGLPPNGASVGQISLSAGWHKIIYRHVEQFGGSSARAAYQLPNDTTWRLVSTENLNLRTLADPGAPSGITLTTAHNTCPLPGDRAWMLTSVDVLAENEPGWYGQSVVPAINQMENVHGNDDEYTSRYVGHFYVPEAQAGIWRFSTDSDDASDLEIDGTLVAHWYGGHGSAGRWGQKGWVDVNEIVGYTGPGEGSAPVFGNQWYTTTAADGTFDVGGLATGKYEVTVTIPGYARQHLSPVTVTAGSDTSLNVEVMRGHRISGLIKDAQGNPLPGVSVAANQPGTPVRASSVSVADGRYVIDNLPPGDYVVNTHTKDQIGPGDWQWARGSRNITVTSGEPGVSGVDFALEPGGSISGTVSSLSGAGQVTGVYMDFHKYDSNEYLGHTNLGGPGTFKFTGIPVGSYRIAAGAKDHAKVMNGGGFDWWAAPPVVVNAGTETSGINFSLPVGRTISGVVREAGSDQPLEGIVIKAEPLAGGPSLGDARTAPDGSFTTSGVPYGQYKIWAASPAQGSTATYLKQYFDHVTDKSAAATISVSDTTGDISGIRFDLSKPSGTIAGSVEYDGSASGKMVIIAAAELSPVTPPAAGYVVNVQGAGSYTYELAGLPDGVYIIRALLLNDDGFQRFSVEHRSLEAGNLLAFGHSAKPASVRNGERLEGVNIGLSACVTLTGQLSYSGAEQKPVYLSISPTTIPGFLDYPALFESIPVTSGAYSIPGVPANSCSFRAFMDLNENGKADLNEPQGRARKRTGEAVVNVDLLPPVMFSGTVTYGGQVLSPDSKPVIIQIISTVSHQGVTSVTRTGPGAYEMPVPVGEYYVKAFMDLNGNQKADTGEPANLYNRLSPVESDRTNVGSLDIHLDDVPKAHVLGQVILEGKQDAGGSTVTYIRGSERSSVKAKNRGEFGNVLPAGEWEVITSSPGFLAYRSTEYLPDSTTAPQKFGRVRLKPGDINGDGLIDVFDMVSMARQIGNTTAGPCDLTGDGRVDLQDIALAAMNYRLTGPAQPPETTQP